MNFTTTHGASVPINIRRRKCTKHLRLSIGQKNQVIASVPWYTSDRTVANFIDDQSEWLEEQISSAPRVYSLYSGLRKNRILQLAAIYLMYVLSLVEDVLLIMFMTKVVQFSSYVYRWWRSIAYVLW